MNEKRVRIKSTCEKYANEKGTCDGMSLSEALCGRRETVYVKVDGDCAYTAILFSDLEFIEVGQ